ncbi:MAG TPA: YbaK/EbsC family protein [Alphaproteobacteria bacterium]|jgi:Ala-tRNA(Pro) deacylase|nr:YbaK/EbsC family protein [Alphaproteobacteria bacterium]MDP7426650.1 YbaK/EbsC family protein [Alphaproteobacteria bacterium]HJM51447.1 YbaK/EbsC family protein [Alphaproteobacteria bacterium]|tara:strand:- start:3092 stop:3562 length:471 start_codon:yes stop_codon:yes gene_type:complete
MAMAMKLKEFLRDSQITFDLVEHPFAVSSSRIAQQSHIPGDALAKCLLLRDSQGYLVAVIPSTHRVDLEHLDWLFDDHLEFADEEEISSHFEDCDPGAVPPLGGAYGMRMAVDEDLVLRRDVYFEAGDHRQLVHVSGEAFGRLTQGAFLGIFSYHA